MKPQIALDAPSPETKTSRDNRVVSYALVDGVQQPLSRFGDRAWLFIEGATNIGRNSRRIDFDHIPLEFRQALKEILYSYYRDGRRSRARPTVMTLRMHYFQVRMFLRHLQESGVTRLEDATSRVCLDYVEKLRLHRTRYGKPLTNASIEKMLLTVELLHEVGRSLRYEIPHPWPRTHAGALACVSRLVGPRAPRTPLIPDDVLSKLYQAAASRVSGAGALLDVRDAVLDVKRGDTKKELRRPLLRDLGWQAGMAELRGELRLLRTACYVVVAALTGCRNHEIAHIKTGAYHRTVDDEGEEYWWLTSVSTKTRAGRSRWMIPEAAVEALKVMERLVSPLHEELRTEIARMREVSPGSPEIAEAQRQEDALFIGKSDRGITTLSASRWCFHLKVFARQHGVDWPLATHQFRRTFAVYAAKSQLGDLRYLKDHFKHWSMDMTLLYAMGGLQEQDLLDEVSAELELLRDGVVASWLDPATKLAGGGGARVMSFRDANPVPMYRTRNEMVNALSLGVHLRSNGHAWCTADVGSACLGNGGVDPTRCTECANAVISPEQAGYYSQLRGDLKALLSDVEIGDSGRWRVERDLARCDAVLSTLGITERAPQV